MERTANGSSFNKQFFSLFVCIFALLTDLPRGVVAENGNGFNLGNADEILKVAKLKLSEGIISSSNQPQSGESLENLGLALRASANGNEKLAFSYYQNTAKGNLIDQISSVQAYEDLRLLCAMVKNFHDQSVMPNCISHLRKFNKFDDLAFSLEFQRNKMINASMDVTKKSVKNYYTLLKRHQRTPLALQTLLLMLDGRPELSKERFECLENLAAPFPLSEASRQAFAALAKQISSGYAPSLWLLRRLAQHQELSSEVAPFIRQSLVRKILDGKIYKVPTLRERMNYFSELRLFDDALSASVELEKLLPAEAKLARSEVQIKQGKLLECELTIKDLLSKEKPPAMIAQAALRRLAYVQKLLGKYAESSATYDRIYQVSRKNQFKFHSFVSDFISKNFDSALARLSSFERGVFPDRDSEAAKLFWYAKSQFAVGDSHGAAATLAQLRTRYKDSFYSLVSQVDFNSKKVQPLKEMSIDEILGAEKSIKVSNLEGNSVYITTESIANATGPEAIESESQNPDAGNNLNDMEKAKLPRDVLELSEEISRVLKVSKPLILAIIENESAFNRNAKSWVGATGLMQLMPITALKTSRFFNQENFNYEQTLDPAYNILLGSGYLSFLLKYYDGSILSSIAAYNAGPKAVNTWIRGCKSCGPAEFVEYIPFNETRWYVKKVIRSFHKFSQIFKADFDYQVVFHMPTQLREDVVIF